MLMDNARRLFVDRKKFFVHPSRSEFIYPFNEESIVEWWNKYNHVLIVNRVLFLYSRRFILCENVKKMEDGTR